MQSSTPVHHALAVALAAGLFTYGQASAQQVVADGDEQTPPPGRYHTTEPVLPGDPRGYAFHALNGGRIVPTGPVELSTEGRAAHAVHVEGVGSLVALEGATIRTAGVSAAGASVAAGASLRAKGVVIETTGNSALGVQVQDADAVLQDVRVHSSGGDALRLRGGTLQVQGGQLQVNSLSTAGLDASAGAATLEGVHIEMGGNATDGVRATGTADVVLHRSSIRRRGYGGVAATVHAGATLAMHAVDIDLQGGAMVGLVLGGHAHVTGSQIAVQGANSVAVQQTGGRLTVQDSVLSGHWGLSLMHNGEAVLRGSNVHSEAMALGINGHGNTVTVERSSLAASAGTGIWMPNQSTLVLRDSSVSAEGDRGLGLDVRGGVAQVFSSVLTTKGSSAHGLYAQDDAGRRPRIEAIDTDVLTEGDGSAAAIARTGGTVTLTDSRMWTLGRSSHGVISGGAGQMILTNTHVLTEGEGAWAAVINDNGRIASTAARW